MANGQGWGDGYVTDVDYVQSFHPGLVPLNLAVAAVAAGVVPPDVDGPFTYLDLGCGNGFTPALVAAAYPQAAVWANDFNPAHIRTAQALADRAGLPNVTFVEASFAALAALDLPPFDFIVAHGIWSWVSEANRGYVAGLIRRLLKPGGLAMLSYNCHPGWDALVPLRRLMLEAAGGGGTALEQVGRGLDAARALRDAGAAYLVQPAVSAALDELLAADRQYLAHEYLNAQWTLFRPDEVAAVFAREGISHAGQGRVLENLDAWWLTPAQRALLAATDAGAREGRRDLILNRRFRSDLFTRGGPAPPEAVAAWIAARPFVLARPRGSCDVEVTVRGREVALPPLATAVLDALATGCATGAALAGRLGAGADAVGEALLLLCGIGHVRPARAAGDRTAGDRAATDRFNAAALARLGSGEPVLALASPVTGSGVTLTTGEAVLLDAMRAGVPLELISMDDGTGRGDAAERFRAELLPMLEQWQVA